MGSVANEVDSDVNVSICSRSCSKFPEKTLGGPKRSTVLLCRGLVGLSTASLMAAALLTGSDGGLVILMVLDDARRAAGNECTPESRTKGTTTFHARQVSIYISKAVHVFSMAAQRSVNESDPWSWTGIGTYSQGSYPQCRHGSPIGGAGPAESVRGLKR